jgi:hypothetical protein
MQLGDGQGSASAGSRRERSYDQSYERPADAQLVDHLGWSQLAEHAARTMTVMVPDIVPANAEMQEKCVSVLDDLFAVPDLLAAHVSNSRG